MSAMDTVLVSPVLFIVCYEYYEYQFLASFYPTSY